MKLYECKRVDRLSPKTTRVCSKKHKLGRYANGACKGCQREYDQKYYLAHRAEESLRYRRWRLDNLEYDSARHKAWRRANKNKRESK